MIFGEFPTADAVGLRLAHTLRLPRLLLKKGHVLTATDAAVLAAAGMDRVTGARLEAGELDEDAAARAVAALLGNTGIEARPPYGGRCNLFANGAGILSIDRQRVDRLNRIDDSVTLATLPAGNLTAKGRRVATVKIIPFAVESGVVAAWQREIGTASPLGVMPLRACRAALVASLTPATAERVVEQALAATRQRLARLGATLALHLRCAHEPAAVAATIAEAGAAGCDLILVLGATVSKDPGDVVPAALVAAGGRVDHFGLPVEPGNMLLVGAIGDIPVLNLPGCARSTARNGVDIVLEHLLSGRPLDRDMLTGLGVGGLLGAGEDEPAAAESAAAEAAVAPAPRIAALVLAAGSSTRMGGRNKLLCPVDGVPMVRRAVNAALASHACQTLVVTGHDAEAVEAALVDRRVSLVHNPHHATGMAGSLRCGLRALPADLDGVLVLLADMPRVDAAVLDRLIEAFDASAPQVLAPVFAGRRGNPVLWPRRHFADMMALSGDTGARGLLECHAAELRTIEIGHDGILADVDTAAALAAEERSK